MRPYMANLNMANGFALDVVSHEDGSSVGLLGSLKISFKLILSQRVAEESGGPLDEIYLGWQPRGQPREILAAKRPEREPDCRCAFIDHQSFARNASLPQLLP